MRKTWVVAIVVSAVFVLGLSCVVYFVAADDVVDGDAATAAGTVLASFAGLGAAVFTAVAAISALRAARESSETARQASEALGLAMQPSLHANVSGPAYGYAQNVLRNQSRPDVFQLEIDPIELRVWNTSRWPAVRIEIQVDLGDGRSGSFSLDRLDPAQDRRDPVTFPFEAARATPIDAPEWVGEVHLIDKIILTYSDERNLLRWRQTIRNPLSYSRRENGITGEGGGGGAVTLERVI